VDFRLKSSLVFENLTARLNQVFDRLRRRGKLTVADVDAALREVRLALLEADVHYSVVKDFLARVRERAIGAEVARALSPGQQVIKIVHQELMATLGEAAPLQLSGPKPRLILLVGLQGSGKTTTAAKLARYLRARGERVLLVAADPYRPAAVEQLQVLGQALDVPVYAEARRLPAEVIAGAWQKARAGGDSVLIADTAGRSQLDEELMEELRSIAHKTPPQETLLVVDAMTGQEALRIAEGFRAAIPLTGLIMTKMDGDARGGAAISIRAVTGVPIKFLGTGEKSDALEPFQPERLASRILGMGDVLGLIEKAEAAWDSAQAAQTAERLMQGEFTLEDLLTQMQQVRKLGPLAQMLEMMPGPLAQAARQVDPAQVERSFRRNEAIILSMTPEERRHPEILNASRRRRIAAGSGTQVQDVNRLMNQFRQMQQLFKTLGKQKGRGYLPNWPV
jgi:signal recognition particle subunit SRP54